MKILLDTQTLILIGQGQLPKRASEAYADIDNEVFFSLVSLWEIGIKASLGKLKFKRKIAEYHDMLVEELDLSSLNIEAIHIQKAVGLPFHHKDPFDRLLIGQALTEGLSVLGSDSQFELYGCDRIWE